MSSSEVPLKKRKHEVDLELWRKAAPSFPHLLGTMFKKGIHTDVIVKVESGNRSKEIECHSLILMAHSPVLSALLSSRWTGELQGHRRIVTLKEDDPYCFNYFVNMMYWDWHEEAFENYEIPKGFTPEITVGVLSLAHKYLACHVVCQAEHVIYCYLLKRSAVDTAKLYNCLKLLPICQPGEVARKTYRTVSNCLLADGENVFSSDAILQLSQSDLADIVKHYNLRCPEEIVYNGCYKWGLEQCKLKELSVTGENVRAALGESVQSIRFPLLDSQIITQLVRSSKVLTDEEMIELLSYIVNRNCEKSIPSAIRFPVEGRVSSSRCLMKRLDLDSVSKHLADYSSFHGFEMTVSKKMAICGVEFFGGKITSKKLKYHVQFEFPKQRIEFFKDVKDFNHAKTKVPITYISISPEVEVPADVPVTITFSISGGHTYVSQEAVDEFRKEITYWEDDTIIITFKSSPNIPNGLKQMTRILFLSTDNEAESMSASSDSD